MLGFSSIIDLLNLVDIVDTLCETVMQCQVEQGDIMEKAKVWSFKCAWCEDQEFIISGNSARTGATHGFVCPKCKEHTLVEFVLTIRRLGDKGGKAGGQPDSPISPRIIWN